MFYFLDVDPTKAVRLLADEDVQSVEPVQELVGVLRSMRVRVGGVHVSSPLGGWVRGCYSNWRWCLEYVVGLTQEHLHRFRRAHPAVSVVQQLVEIDVVMRSRLPAKGNTIPPVLCGAPQSVVVVSFVTQYQWLYGEERRKAVWTRRVVPAFVPQRRRRVRGC